MFVFRFGALAVENRGKQPTKSQAQLRTVCVLVGGHKQTGAMLRLNARERANLFATCQRWPVPLRRERATVSVCLFVHLLVCLFVYLVVCWGQLEPLEQRLRQLTSGQFNVI